jgi:CrcB protein
MPRDRPDDGARPDDRRVDPELAERGRRTDPLVLLAISAGGVAGTAARYAIGRAFPAGAGGFPWATLAVNLTGSFVLGAFLAWLLAARPRDRFFRPLVAVGFLGGYTTFSTAMVESAVLTKDGHAPVALAYVVASLVGGLLAVALGVRVVRRTVRC